MRSINEVVCLEYGAVWSVLKSDEKRPIFDNVHFYSVGI